MVSKPRQLLPSFLWITALLMIPSLVTIRSLIRTDNISINTLKNNDDENNHTKYENVNQNLTDTVGANKVTNQHEHFSNVNNDSLYYNIKNMNNNYLPSNMTDTTKIHILHVINPYIVQNGTKKFNTKFAPFFDMEQYFAWKSLAPAKQYIAQTNPNNIQVFVACGILPNDIQHLTRQEQTKSNNGEISLNSFCNGTFVLNRSTATEYPENIAMQQKQLPFVKDIILGGLELQLQIQKQKNDGIFAESQDNTITSHQKHARRFVIFTNSDIGLNIDFYERVYNVTQKNPKLQAFTFNRRIIYLSKQNDIDNKNYTSTSPFSMESIYNAIPHGQMHPGHDCFIFERHLIPNITRVLGHMFVGYPPWAMALFRQLKYNLLQNDQFVRYRSTIDATFHVGGHGEWYHEKQTSNDNITSTTITPARREIQYLQDACPHDVPTTLSIFQYQNTLNCAQANITFEAWMDQKRNVHNP